MLSTSDYATTQAATYMRMPSILKTLDPGWCITPVNGRYQVRIWCLRARAMRHVGCYGTRDEAIRARDAAMKARRGN